MQRRKFSTALATVTVTGLGLSSRPVAAQGGPVEGTHFLRMSPPAPVSAPTGKVEVVEFFWYGCPHCNALEPTLEAWLKKLPSDVAFRRVPVAFGAAHEAHQRLYYGLESIGQLEAAHRRIFAAIHVDRRRLDKEAEQVEFIKSIGIDGSKFVDATKSFSVQTKMRQAKQLAEAYKIDGVPALGIHGRYLTSGSLAGDNERALAVTDFLIQRVRKG